jgi:hypothetical protein
MISVIMEASNREEVRASRFFPAGFHAHLVFGLARRTGIILHARRLLLAAHLAARLSLDRIVGAAEANKHQQRDRTDSHDEISFWCLNENA